MHCKVYMDYTVLVWRRCGLLSNTPTTCFSIVIIMVPLYGKGQIPLRYPARELVADQLASWSQTCSRAE